MTVLDDLAQVLAPGDLVTDPDRMASYRTDHAPGLVGGKPLAVLFPRSTDQVSGILRCASAHGTPVVPRGAGSGLAGGANAIDGGLVLSLEKMASILEISPADGVAVVQPGVLNDDLRKAALRRGMTYAPDPSSRALCSIGGNVATNAGGLCCVKYGVTRDSVLALEVVLADGSVTRVGHRSIKGVAGYDLVGVFVGSEGTLGVVTEVTVKLLPAPAAPVTLVAMLPSLDAASRAVEGVLAVGTPSLLELMDRATIRAVEAYRPAGLDTEAAALILAQSDLPGEAGQIQARAFEAACRAAGATETYCSETVEESEALLEARRVALLAIERLGYVLIDDVAVPRGRLGEMIAAITRVAEEHGVESATLGHAGDGNLHPHFIAPHGDEDAIRRTRDAFYAALDEARALGGTVTGEHGVGALKRLALRDELDPVATRLSAGIKQLLDPQGILNPGKAVPLEPGSRDDFDRGA